MKFLNSRRIASLILALLLTLSLSATLAFATDSQPSGEATTAVSGTEATPADTLGAEDDTKTTGAGDTDADDGDTETTGSTEDGDDKSSDGDGKTEKTINWDLIVTLSIIGLAVIVFLLFFFINKKFNAKVKKTLKDLSSELKKIVWSPWRDVKKNTITVIVISLGAALLIFVLDLIFNKSLSALTTLVRGTV
jgi:preprotein translocase SecE subunit